MCQASAKNGEVSQVGSHMEDHICQSSGGVQSLPALCHKLPTPTAFYAAATALVIVS